MPRAEHEISRKSISVNAIKVLYRLERGGYNAYLVGGGVRDLLLGREPKDFDVATDAKPEQVRKLFRNCRLIGRRFRLAHIHFKDEIVEVATFRANESKQPETNQQSDQGIITRDNAYGSLEDDVWRRDFTVNALYYNIADFSIVDYTGGLADLQNGLVRIIGDPIQRLHEDPIRILRAIRFATKLGFRIHEDTDAAMHLCLKQLQHVPAARIFDEALKLLLGGNSVSTYAMLRHYKAFELLFPDTEQSLSDAQSHQQAEILIIRTLENTDERVQTGKFITPAFLFAAFLWYPTQALAKELQKQHNYSAHMAFDKAVNQILSRQTKSMSIPRRFTLTMRQIWQLQYQFTQRQGRRPLKFIHHARFRAAYDFLLLRAEAEPELENLAEWWTDFHNAEPDQQQELLNKVNQRKRKHKRKK